MDAEAHDRQFYPGEQYRNRKQKETSEKGVKEMAKQLIDVHCIREDYCEYPVAVRILMDDGTVQTYGLENKMEYKFNNLMKAVRKSVEIGYQYKRPTKRRSRTHRSQL